MKNMLVWLGLGIFIGYFWGRFTTSKIYALIFKQFQDEMHEQYLTLLAKHNITKKKPDKKKNFKCYSNNQNDKSA